MPAAVAIPAGISAASSIGQGIVGSRASRRAAREQAQAAQQAGALVMDASREVVPWVREAGERAARDVSDVSTSAAEGVLRASEEANRTLGDVYRDMLGRIDPYSELGLRTARTLAEMAGPDGEITRKFTMADFEEDPGYRFRLAEGQKALERSAAVRGMLQSGQTLKALTGYAQGMASQEYQNAFERFMRQRQQRYAMLSDLASMGERANEMALRAGTWYGGNVSDNTMRGSMYAGDARMRGAMYAGDARMGSERDAARLALGAAEYAGNAAMGRGNALAAGHMGAANAWNRALGSLGQTAMDVAGYYQLRDLMRQPQQGIVANEISLPLRPSPAANNPLLWPIGSLKEKYPELFRLATSTGI